MSAAPQPLNRDAGRRLVRAVGMERVPGCYSFPDGDGRPVVMVASYMRSGTHFLMNAIARGFGYVSRPWLDVDSPPMTLNVFAPEAVAGVFSELGALDLATLVKTHHEAPLMAPALQAERPPLIFYIHRDPRAVHRSLWRYHHRLGWDEGPRCRTPAELMRTPPSGRMLRYSTEQQPTMLHRWAAHVERWLALADAEPPVVPVAYEALAEDYPGTLARLGESLGMAPLDLTPPDRSESILPGDWQDTAADAPAWTPEDERFLRSVCPALLDRLIGVGQ